jgi:predicted RNase H-like HicB family nuclease
MTAKYDKYSIRLTYHEEESRLKGYWLAEHPALWGCAANGSTPNIAVNQLAIAKDAWMASRRAAGQPIPEPDVVLD